MRIAKAFKLGKFNNAKILQRLLTVSLNSLAFFSNLAANRYLAVRMELLAAGIVFLAASSVALASLQGDAALTGIAALALLKIGVIAGNDPISTDYNRAYRTAFEGALFFGVGRNQVQAERCGYNFELSFQYYSHDEIAASSTRAALLEGAP